MTVTIGVVVLSQGSRPAELARCLDSLRAQTGVGLDVLVVGNGWQPTGLGPDVRGHGLVENVGIPQGRNVGATLTGGELVFFFDDDAWLPAPDVLARIAGLFAARPRLGSAQPRICDPDGTTLRRWVPRVPVGDPARPGPARTVQEGVAVVRRAAFEQLGGWAGEFFYGHEGVDLAWRMWDAGWEVWYAGDLVVHHPATDPARHAEFYRRNAKNRVWAARRNLPWPVLAGYLSVWTAITMARLARQPAAARVWWAGFVEGWRTDPGRRRPMRWRTVARLTRLGQPPIV